MLATFVVVFGWCGAGLIVLAYALVSFDVINKGYRFHAMNAVGAIGIIAAAFAKGDYPPAGLNAVWFLVAVIAILKTMRAKRRSS